MPEFSPTEIAKAEKLYEANKEHIEHLCLHGTEFAWVAARTIKTIAEMGEKRTGVDG